LTLEPCAGCAPVARAFGFARGGAGADASLKLSHVIAAATTPRPEMTSVGTERLLFLFMFIRHETSPRLMAESLYSHPIKSAGGVCG